MKTEVVCASKFCTQIDPANPVDRWISYAVKVLRDGGIETYESCEGGSGHACLEPTVRFHGKAGEGFRAFGIAQQSSLPIRSLRRLRSPDHSVPTRTYWELTFHSSALTSCQRQAERNRLIC